MGLEMSLHRSDFRWLMLKGVQPMRVTRHDLEGRYDGSHPHSHRKHSTCCEICLITQEVQRADCPHDKCRGEICCKHHMHEAIGKRWVEDDSPPVKRDELARVIETIASRCLHPAVHRQDPEGGEECPERNHQCCKEVERGADPFPTKQHDAEKACFQKEG